MSKVYTFRHINKNNLGWHLELSKGEGAPYFGDWLWTDGQLDDGYQYSAGFFARVPSGIDLGIDPEKKNWPYVQLCISSPDGDLYYVDESYPPESFKTREWGALIGNNIFDGKINDKGMPESYDLRIDIGNVGINVTARVIVTGVQFSDEAHGYSYYHPKRNIALGWWPLAPRAEINADLRFAGKTVKKKGLAYCERQLSNMPNAFGAGGQSMWYWGHFFAGDYTAVWTDSAASGLRQYRHFTPFVLWKGKEIVVSTYNFACCTEKWGFDLKGRIYPVVVSLRSSDGNRDVNVQLLQGKVIDTWKIENPDRPDKPGYYSRQFCNFDMQIKHWGNTEEIHGTAVHEFGGGPSWYPYNE